MYNLHKNKTVKEKITLTVFYYSVFATVFDKLLDIIYNTSWVLYNGRRFSLFIREVIAMVTYSDMFLFVSILISLISLCYFIFNKKK